MSKLSKNDFGTPINAATRHKLMGVIQRGYSEQATAADATSNLVGGTPAIHSGKVRDAFVVLSARPASGESITIDVLKNGHSILSSAYNINDTIVGGDASDYFDVGGQVTLPVEDGTEIAAGDVITVTRDYTAGGTPTPIGPNVIVIEWA